jgi:hypothetical protein
MFILTLSTLFVLSESAKADNVIVSYTVTVKDAVSGNTLSDIPVQVFATGGIPWTGSDTDSSGVFDFGNLTFSVPANTTIWFDVNDTFTFGGTTYTANVSYSPSVSSLAASQSGHFGVTILLWPQRWDWD